MKRLLFISLALILANVAGAQSSIDKLFDKYQGQKGFTTVTVNGSFLKFMAEIDDEDEDLMKFADKFTNIRILAQEDDELQVDNFYDLVIDEVMKGGYEEMVTINSEGSDVKILVRADGKVFKEFLLIAGGDENAIIQIKGNFSYDEVKEMSSSVKDGHGVHGISGIELF